MSHTSQRLGLCSAIDTALQDFQLHSVFEAMALIANAYSRQGEPCSLSSYPRDLVYACAAPSCVSACDNTQRFSLFCDSELAYSGDNTTEML